MKSRILLFVVLVSLIGVSSCKKNDPGTSPNTYYGAWQLKNVSGGLMGINLNYTTGEVIWSFDENTSKLTVINNIISTGSKSIFARLATGTYTFSISKNGKRKNLFVDNVDFGTIHVNNGVLLLDEGVAADGFLTEFGR